MRVGGDDRLGRGGADGPKSLGGVSLGVAPVFLKQSNQRGDGRLGVGTHHLEQQSRTQSLLAIATKQACGCDDRILRFRQFGHPGKRLHGIRFRALAVETAVETVV